MRHTTRLFLVAATLLLPSSGFAQVQAQLGIGSRVRIVPIQGNPLIGQVTSLERDSIVLLESRHGTARTVARSDVTRLQVSRGRRTGSSALTGGLVGLASGAIVGGLLGASYKSSGSVCPIACSPQSSAALGGALLGAGGFLLGSLVGSLAGGERWVDVPLAADIP